MAFYILFFGFFSLLLSSSLSGIDPLKQKSINFVVTFFILLVSFISLHCGSTQLFFLSKVFHINSFDKYAASLILLYFILTHINLWQCRRFILKEIYLCQLALAALSLALIFANHVIVYVLCVPLLILVIFLAPALKEDTAVLSKKHLINASYWYIAVLIVLGMTCIFWNEFAQLTMNDLSRIFSHLGENKSFRIGWILVFGVLLVLFIDPLLSLKSAYIKASEWVLISQFQMFLPFVVTLVMYKWIFVFGVIWNKSQSIFVENGQFRILTIVFLVFLIGSLFSVIKGVWTSHLLDQLLGATKQILLVSFVGIASGDAESLNWSLTLLSIYVFAVPLIIQILQYLQIPVSAYKGHVLDYAKRPSLGILVALALGLFTLGPLGNLVSLQLIRSVVKHWSSLNSTQHGMFLSPFFYLLSTFCVISLLMVYIVQFFRALLYKPEKWIEGNVDDVAGWIYFLLAPLIFVGIYPGSLYRYVELVVASLK